MSCKLLSKIIRLPLNDTNSFKLWVPIPLDDVEILNDKSKSVSGYIADKSM